MIRLPRYNRLRRNQPNDAREKPDKVVESYDIMEAHESYVTFRERVVANLPIIGSIAIILFAISKVLLIAHGDVSTALAIVNSAGPLQVLIGTLVTVSPLLAIGMGGALAFGLRDRLSPRERHILYWFLAVMAFWLSTVVIYISTIGIIGYLLILWFRRWRNRRKLGSSKEQINTLRPTDELLLRIKDQLLQFSPSDLRLQELLKEIRVRESAILVTSECRAIDLAEIRKLRAEQIDYIRKYAEREQHLARVQRRSLDVITATFLAIAMIPLLPHALNDEPWLPPESIDMSDHSTEYGYVLDHSSQWITVLTLEERQILSLDTESVLSSTICVDSQGGMDGEPTRTIWRLFAHLQQRYDDCNY